MHNLVQIYGNVGLCILNDWIFTESAHWDTGTKFYSYWNLMKPGSQSGTYGLIQSRLKLDGVDSLKTDHLPTISTLKSVTTLFFITNFVSQNHFLPWIFVITKNFITKKNLSQKNSITKKMSAHIFCHHKFFSSFICFLHICFLLLHIYIYFFLSQSIFNQKNVIKQFF